MHESQKGKQSSHWRRIERGSDDEEEDGDQLWGGRGGEGWKWEQKSMGASLDLAGGQG